LIYLFLSAYFARDQQSKMQEVPESKDVGLRRFDVQVAGHAEGAALGSKALLKRDDKLFKPLQSGTRGLKELKFYEELSKEIPSFVHFVPTFYGCEEALFNGDLHKYIILEDLTHFYDKTSLCVEDIKMGTRTYDDDASDTKREYEMSKAANTTTVTHGFRFCGIRGYDMETGTKHFPKNWGKTFNAVNINDSVRTFLSNGKRVRKDLIPLFLDDLTKILSWFESNDKFRFIGSSLLLLYNGDDTKPADKEAMIRIIDFAHVDRIAEGSRDDGYIFGLKSLIKVFQDVLAEPNIQ